MSIEIRIDDCTVYEKDDLGRVSLYRACSTPEEALHVAKLYLQGFGVTMGEEHKFIRQWL